MQERRDHGTLCEESIKKESQAHNASESAQDFDGLRREGER